MTKRPLRAIFFDIDDTLYSSSEFAAIARLNAVKAMIHAGLDMEITECLVILKNLMANSSSSSNLLLNDLLKEAGAETYKNKNESVLIAAGVVAYHNTKANRLKAYADVVEVLNILSQKTPLCLGVLSSGYSIKQAEKLCRCNLVDYFNQDAIFFSEGLKVDKPSTEFYLKPLEKLGFSPSEVMYVGDRPVYDVYPVKKIDMISVLNRRSGKYLDVESDVKPDYTIHDFWQLLDIVTNDFAYISN